MNRAPILVITRNEPVVGHVPLVSVFNDGTMEYGPGYQPDAAARAFWEALADLRPHCAGCKCAPAPQLMEVEVDG